MNQKEIDKWFSEKWGEDLEFYERSLGGLYKIKETVEGKEDILQLINENISTTYGEILWLRGKM